MDFRGFMGVFRVVGVFEAFFRNERSWSTMIRNCSKGKVHAALTHYDQGV